MRHRPQLFAVYRSSVGLFLTGIGSAVDDVLDRINYRFLMRSNNIDNFILLFYIQIKKGFIMNQQNWNTITSDLLIHEHPVATLLETQRKEKRKYQTIGHLMSIEKSVWVRLL